MSMIAATAALIGVTTVEGGMFSKKPDHLFKWEWPADRSVEVWRIGQVARIEKMSSGFLGIGASPSIAENLLDGHSVSGVLSEAGDLSGTFSIGLPGLKAASLVTDTRAAFGFESSGNCICAIAVPNDITDDQMNDWLMDVDCS